MRIERVAFFPEELRSRRQWVLWRKESRDGKTTKVPYQRNGRRASSTNPATWATFEQVRATLSRSPESFSGVGFVFTDDDPLVFVDLDHCFTGERLSEIASDILSNFCGQFVEVSQSGSGLHIICKGAIDRSFKNSALGVECYNSGRFVAMTGNAVSACEPHDDTEALRFLCNKYGAARKQNKSPRAVSGYGHLSHDDAYIVRKASAHGGKFADLYAGNYESCGYHSQSEADLALCVLLAFWTDRDPEAIDRIFRTSGLYRAKWERADYRFGSSSSIGTIPTACARCTESLSEFIVRRRREEAEELERAILENC